MNQLNQFKIKSSIYVCFWSRPLSLFVHRCCFQIKIVHISQVTYGKKKMETQPTSMLFKHNESVMRHCIETKGVKSNSQHINLFSFIRVKPRAVQQQHHESKNVWLTALSSPPLSPPSLLEREEVKCTPSNKHTQMPMQNTLPSLLATAIFLKLMSSRAPEASLSLELTEVKWADGWVGKVRSPMWIHLMPRPPNVFFLVRFEKRKKKTFYRRLYATKLVAI